MAVSFHHVAVLFALIFAWFWVAKARSISEDQESFLHDSATRDKFSNEKGSNFFLTEEFVPDVPLDAGRPFRAPRKILQPRATRMGDFELFTARGYGKRSAPCTDGACKKQLPFFGARRYGKRDLNDNETKKMRRIICLLANCNRKTELALNLDNAFQAKGKSEDDTDVAFDD